MKSSFLDYYKVILDKVSFDHELLKKEYQKAYQVLTEHEVEQLDAWLQARGLHRKLETVRTSQNQHSKIFSKVY